MTFLKRLIYLQFMPCVQREVHLVLFPASTLASSSPCCFDTLKSGTDLVQSLNSVKSSFVGMATTDLRHLLSFSNYTFLSKETLRFILAFLFIYNFNFRPDFQEQKLFKKINCKSIQLWKKNLKIQIKRNLYVRSVAKFLF